MGWWFKLRCKVRRLFGLPVQIVAYRNTFENGKFKRTPIYVDQFYK
jgi:hypothetical protein